MDIPSDSPLRRPPSDYCPPGSEHWFELKSGPDAGRRLFYFDHKYGEGDPAATVLLVHGNPESSYTYRHVRDALGASGRPVRVIAPDHIGFGLSDQAHFEMIDFHHADNLAQLVAYLDLRDITLVVHDWGGPIGIGSFIEYPERVTGLVVLNTTVFPMPPDGLTYENFPFSFLPWCKTPYMVPDSLWGGVAAAVVSSPADLRAHRFVALMLGCLARAATVGFDEGSPEYVWSTALASKANARSSKRNVLQTPVWGHGYRYDDPVVGPQDNHDFYRAIQDGIGGWWAGRSDAIPVAGFFGAIDPLAKQSVLAQWRDALPQIDHEMHEFPNLSHFIEEHKGPEIAAAILRMRGLWPTNLFE